MKPTETGSAATPIRPAREEPPGGAPRRALGEAGADTGAEAGRHRRRYDSPLRRERAAATRASVIEAAAQAFAAHGYNGATVVHIAAGAAVSPDTVGLVGPKAFLLLEAFRTRYAGEGGWHSLLEQPHVREIFDIQDPTEAIAATVDFLTRAHSSSAQLWLLIRATAATDPHVGEAFGELTRLKRHSFEHTTRWLLRTGVLPPLLPDSSQPVDGDTGTGVDPSFRRLVAEVSLLMSAETYLVLTTDHDFTLADYRDWLTQRLSSQRS